MMRTDHPNATWLSELYGRSAEIANDPTLGDAERNRLLAEHQGSVMQRLSPELVVHTGGVKLSTTGGAAFLPVYAQRRAKLAGGPTTPVAVYLVLADDEYGIIYMRVRHQQGDEHPAMGAWRFEDGLAVEHWELGNGQAWDEFYLGADPTLKDGDAYEYWTRTD